MIKELIISFDYHSGKTVKKLRKLELEKKTTTNEEIANRLEEEIEVLQQDYEAKLKPVVQKLHLTLILRWKICQMMKFLKNMKLEM